MISPLFPLIFQCSYWGSQKWNVNVAVLKICHNVLWCMYSMVSFFVKHMQGSRIWRHWILLLFHSSPVNLFWEILSMPVILSWFTAMLDWGFPQSSVVKNLPAVQEMQETQVWFLDQEDSLEKEMATYSSILAWEIPWTEESGGLQSRGSQRVRHDWVTEHKHECVFNHKSTHNFPLENTIKNTILEHCGLRIYSPINLHYYTNMCI